MSTLLGMTASAANATHKHEFQRFANEPTMNNNVQSPFTHPWQFLNGKLQALTTAYTTVTSTDPRPSTADGHTSDASEESTGVLSTATSDSKPTKQNGELKVKQPKSPQTAYLLSHPAPKSRTHLIRPRHRMLLQMRRVTKTRSPTPALEVYPGSAFPRSMLRKLPQTTKQSCVLGNADLLILNCPSEKDDSKNLDLAHRDVVGFIHTVDVADTPDIYIGSSQWSSSRFEKHRYEFKSTDDDGNEVIARWWLKHSRKSKTLDKSSAGRKFNFSVLRKGTRKHPVIGHMDQTSIDVCDQFTIPESPTDTPVVSPSEGFSPLSLGDGHSKSYFNTAYPPPNTTVDTSEDLKKLMLVTGIWVAIAEGWSDALNAHFEAKNGHSGSNSGSVRMRSASGRTSSWENRAETQSVHSCRSRISSFGHRSSMSSNPTSPNINNGVFPRRSNTVGSSSGRRRGDSTTHGDTADDARSVVSEHEPIMEEPSKESLEKNTVPSRSMDSLQADFTIRDAKSESSHGLKGIFGSIKKSEKRKSLIGMVQRKNKN